MNAVLVFRVEAATYAIDIRNVKEIREWSAVTRIPRASPDVLGMVNVRGDIIPVIDLGARLSPHAAVSTQTRAIIILQHQTSQGLRKFAIAVDEGHDIVDLPAEAIQRPRSLRDPSHGGIIIGLASVANWMLILLDAGALAPDNKAAATP